MANILPPKPKREPNKSEEKQVKAANTVGGGRGKKHDDQVRAVMKNTIHTKAIRVTRPMSGNPRLVFFRRTKKENTRKKRAKTRKETESER